MNAGKTGSEYRIGPGMSSLIMIAVSLCMAALAILALAETQSGGKLSDRGRESTAAYYRAAAQLQRELLTVDRALYHARAEAGGDEDAYADAVLALADGDIPALEEALEGEGGLELCLAVPIIEEQFLRAVLVVPLALTGPRYVMRSHIVENDAPWMPEEELHLFPFSL